MSVKDTDARQAVIEALANMLPTGKDKTDWTSIDTELEFGGKKMVLPADPSKMSIDAGIEYLERVKKDERQEFDTTELVVGAPWDALAAVFKAIQELYGVISPQDTMSFWGPIKPDYITIQHGPNPKDKIQVPAGKLRLPKMSHDIHVGMANNGCQITGIVTKKERAVIVEIADLAREILSTRGLYKGKAIQVGVTDDGRIKLDRQPTFLDLSRVTEDDMIHTHDTSMQIKTNIMSPLKHTEACRRNKIPLKRGILLSGKYGTGKSLTARVVAKVAIDNGWTFILLDRSQGLKTAIEFAKTYQPCVIFAEDIDRAADRSNEKVNDLVNLLDGVISKDMEIMTILTTNFVEKIDPALLRPGRFDAIITLQEPDAETSIRLVQAYARNLLKLSADELVPVGEKLKGSIPSAIREVVERAKLAMLTEDREMLSQQDLITASMDIQTHLKLLAPPIVETKEEVFYKAFQHMIAGVMRSPEANVSQQNIMKRIETFAERASGKWGLPLEPADTPKALN